VTFGRQLDSELPNLLPRKIELQLLKSKRFTLLGQIKKHGVQVIRKGIRYWLGVRRSFYVA
jgi:hypothetical protein